MVKALQPFSGLKVGLWTSLPEREDWKESQERFVRDLEECFVAAGWECIVLLDVQIRPQPLGILLVACDGNTPPANPDFGPLVGAFEAAGMTYQQRRMPLQGAYTAGITTSDPVVYVGPVYNRGRYAP